ncbi:MAG: Hsp20 family protein [Halobacteriota archaeon]
MLDLPAEVLPDKAEAKFTNGVLEVTMPKKEPTEVEQKKRVAVK